MNCKYCGKEFRLQATVGMADHVQTICDECLMAADYADNAANRNSDAFERAIAREVEA